VEAQLEAPLLDPPSLGRANEAVAVPVPEQQHAVVGRHRVEAQRHGLGGVAVERDVGRGAQVEVVPLPREHVLEPLLERRDIVRGEVGDVRVVELRVGYEDLVEELLPVTVDGGAVRRDQVLDLHPVRHILE
jgi:hypothetical protein